MSETRSNRLGNSLLSENLLKKLISAAVCRIQARHGLTDQDLADMIGSCGATIGNARNMESKLQSHALFNLLAVDDFALEGLLAHYNRRSVPIEAKCSTDELVSTSAAVASIALVKSPDSHGGVNVTDVECLEIEHSVDAALEALSALKQRAVQIRAARAA